MRENPVVGTKPYPIEILGYLDDGAISTGIQVIWESPRIFTIHGHNPEYRKAFESLATAGRRMRRAWTKMDMDASLSVEKSDPDTGAAVTDRQGINAPQEGRVVAASGSGPLHPSCNRFQAPPVRGQI